MFGAPTGVHSLAVTVCSLCQDSQVIRSSGSLYLALVNISQNHNTQGGSRYSVVRLQTHVANTSIDLCDLGKNRGHAVISMPIYMLPDNVLLDIFDFRRIGEPEPDHRPWKWKRLVHVCRRWRQIIFASPIRFHIQLYCKNGTHVRKLLGCWPAFLINIHYHNWGDLDLSHDEDNVFAALENPNRVCLLQLYIGAPQLAKLATVMREPFPVLTTLRLSLNHSDEPCLVIPSGFLGRSAPCLQELHLGAVLLQGLPTLLSSARDLVTLHLTNIPPAGYISPEGMVACLAALTGLEYLYIQTDTSTSLPYRIDAAPKHGLSFPHSHPLDSAMFTTTWRTLWPESTALDSTLSA